MILVCVLENIKLGEQEWGEDLEGLRRGEEHDQNIFKLKNVLSNKSI